MLQSNLEFELDFSIGFLVFENFQTIDIITLNVNCEVTEWVYTSVEYMFDYIKRAVAKVYSNQI